MLLMSVPKPFPIRKLFRRYGSAASLVKANLPHYKSTQPL
jgi:hypothetical protein